MDIALLVTIKSELDILESFIASAEYKIANLYNFRIRGKPREVYPNLPTLFLEISSPFDFHPGISRIWFAFPKFTDFLEVFPVYFRTICHLYENFGIFDRSGKRPESKVDLAQVDLLSFMIE